MFDIIEMHRILVACCQQLRKGPVIETGGFGTHIYDMPPFNDPAFAHCEKIDCHFVTVAVDKSAAENEKAAFIELLNAWPEPESLKDGCSYLAAGGVLGDQGAAFEMFALGEVLQLWVVITPKALGMVGEVAEFAAGRGYVMCSGYTPAG